MSEEVSIRGDRKNECLMSFYLCFVKEIFCWENEKNSSQANVSRLLMPLPRLRNGKKRRSMNIREIKTNGTALGMKSDREKMKTET
jgi:hypothetical protein